LIGGVRVKLGEGEKQKIMKVIGVKIKERGYENAQAHLVELLKLKTIQKIESKLVDYTKAIYNSGRVNYNEDEVININIIHKVLREVGVALKLSTNNDIELFIGKNKTLANIYQESNNVDPLISVKNLEERTKYVSELYSYPLFTDANSEYELCTIEKELTALNIFKLFYNLTTMNEDPSKEAGQTGGTIIDEKLEDANTTDNISQRLQVYEKLLKESKKNIKDIREIFVSVDLVKEVVKTGITRGKARSDSDPVDSSEELDEDEDEDFVGEAEFTDLSPENRQAFNNILNEVRRGGIIKTLEFTENGKTFKWGISNNDNNKRFTLYTIDNRRAVLNEQLIQVAESENIQDRKNLLLTTYGTLKGAIVNLNENIKKLEGEYAKDTLNIKRINTLIVDIRKDKETVIKSHNDFVGKNKHAKLRPDSLAPPNIFSSPGLSLEADMPGQDSSLLMQRTAELERNALQNAAVADVELVGGNPVKYKSTGQVVHIMFQNKKYKRVIYVKDKRNTKYCKMNNEYILLSRMKVIE
jgi:hypothetical protein